MQRKKIIILSTLGIILLIFIITGIYYYNKPNVRVEDRFKEIQGFTFNYPIFDGWDVSSIKTSEIDGKMVSTISFINLENKKLSESMQLKIIKKPGVQRIDFNTYDKNPNAIAYMINNDVITFYMKDFSVDIILFVFNEPGFSKSFLSERIIKTFIKN